MDGGIFIEKLALKVGAPYIFSLTPYFWSFDGVILHENIIKAWKDQGVIGLHTSKVNIFIEDEN